MEYVIGSLIDGIDSSLIDARNAVDRLNRGVGGREVALVITKLQEAKMWAEEALKLVAEEMEG